jgi:hypothetical protein
VLGAWLNSHWHDRPPINHRSIDHWTTSHSNSV